MPISKRTRYEVLRRDNHTCRYCGGTAPDAVLTIDHVTPTALGGSDAPDNLVAACKDCNAGKTSTSPDGPLVADVKQLDIAWAGAIKRVAAVRSRQRRKQDKYCVAFLDHWNTWKRHGSTLPIDENWSSGIKRFYDLGVPLDELMHCVDVACGNTKVYSGDVYRYFAGCVWRVVTEMQEAAKALLTAENVDGDA